MIIIKNDHTFSSFFIASFLVLCLITVYNEMSLLFRAKFVFGALCWIYVFLIKQTVLNAKNIFTVSLIILLSTLINIKFVGNYDSIQVFKLFIVYLPFAILTLETKLRSRIFLVTYYFTASYIFLFSILKGYPYNISENTSCNYIPFFLLLNLFFYYLPFKETNKTPSHIPAIIGLIECIIIQGRAGILAFFILAFGESLLQIFDIKGKGGNVSGKKLLISAIISISFGVLIVVVLFTNFATKYLSRFVDQGFDTPRFELWLEYIVSVFSNFKSALIGYNLSDLILLEAFKGNIHSSFFRLHAYMGLVPLLCVFYVFIKLSITFFKQKKIYLGLYLIAFFLKLVMDQFFPFFDGDLLIMILVLYSFSLNKSYGK